MKQIGRPPFKITRPVLSKTRKLMSKGLTKKAIASELNISYSTLMKKQQQHSSLRDAMTQGHEDLLASIGPLRNELYEQALISGNTKAQIKYLKRCCPERWTTKGILAREARERQEKFEQERETELRKQRRKRVQRLARKPKLSIVAPVVQPVTIRVYIGEDLPKNRIMLVPVTTTSRFLESFGDRADENTTVAE